MNEKIKHFSLLTGSTLIMAVGTYFFKFTTINEQVRDFA